VSVQTIRAFQNVRRIRGGGWQSRCETCARHRAAPGVCRSAIRWGVVRRYRDSFFRRAP
jgi:hypothetical protein